ncbi:MAG: hypothetical protein JWR26_4795 [Pedosphaera sp.]|nr:hypothetical protein [Pedosphaera sp.]
MVRKLGKLLLFVAMPALAQNDDVAASQVANGGLNSPPGIVQSQTSVGLTNAQSIGNIRLECIQNRRAICGKILKVLPDGLVIQSGYTNLMRAPLNRSWLVPGSVNEQPAADLVEDNQPDCVCIGLIFLTDLPKKPEPKLYDYVNLTGYPTGQYTYTSVGDVRRTVRRFSASLPNAIEWKCEETKIPSSDAQTK